MNNNREENLQKMKDANLPVMVVPGDMDEMVPVTKHADVGGHNGGDESELRVRGSEQGISRGPVIQTGLKPICEFFAKHTKQ